MSEPQATETAHPPLPVVHDEAGDTPAWLPVSGVALFVVFALFALWRASYPAEEGVEGDGDVAVEVVD